MRVRVQAAPDKKCLGLGSSDLAWLGWGQTIRARNGRTREGGKELHLLHAPATAGAPAKYMQMQILTRDRNQDGGRRRMEGGCVV